MCSEGVQYLVCVSVCVSITQYLTFHVIIRATNDTNLLSGGWRSKSLSDFLWKCFVAKLVRLLLVRLQDKSAIFYSAENMHTYKSGPRTWLAAINFVFGRDVLCEFADYWPLAVSLPPTKLCPQCKASVPVRWKTCECCYHVFRSKRKAECNLWETLELWNVWEQ